MTNQQQNTEMWSGDDVVLPFVILDDEGAIDPLNNFSEFTYTVKDKAGGVQLFTPQTKANGGVVIDTPPGTNGRLHVVIGSALTKTAPIVGKYQDFVHELEGTRIVGGVKTLCEGTFRLHQSVSGV